MTTATVSTQAEVAGRLSLALGSLNRKIRSTNDGISVGLISALATVVDHEGIRPSDLARLEGIAAPSATRMVAELEQRGLVLRETDPADGRAVLVHATPFGAETLVRARAKRAERLLAILGGPNAVDPKKLAVTVQVLEGLLAQAETV